MNRRVVVTGMGVISPLGNNVQTFRENLRQGVSGFGPVTAFDAGDFPIKEACVVKDFNPRSYGTHLLDPFIQYAVAATTEAVEDAGLDISSMDPFRVGISVSSSKGGVHTIDRFRERFQKNRSAILGARIYCNSVPNFAAQWIARRWKVRGPAKCYVAACATGTVAVGEGARMVQDGTVDYCIAGASDASVVPLMLSGYDQMKALCRGPMKPFHKDRSGFAVGEGSGIVILESLESAEARGAKIYGEVLGSTSANNGSNAMHFSPEMDSLSRSLGQLSERAGIQKKDLHYINLHGTATAQGDFYETEEVKKFLGAHVKDVAMSSTKSMTGHMLGASGAIEVIACLIAMQDQFIPPTIHLDQPDPKCDLDYTPLKARDANIQNAISISMGFGGHVATIALTKK